MSKSIYIYGASGHGLVVADIAMACGYDDIIFVDDGDNDYPSFEDIKTSNDIPITFGIGNNIIRANLFERVQNGGFKIVSLIHPNSVLSSSVIIGLGTVVMPNVVVNAKATVGDGVILNSSCVVEHECIIEDFVHISPNVALAGNVKVEKYSHIGIGSQVIQGIIIGNNTVIGAGSTVVKNIENFKKAYGNPCREVEDIK
jgi:UDP-N-acetylbacillosamine N-acetyltransferase